MNKSLFKKELQENRVRFLFCFLLLVVTALVTVIAYPRLQELFISISGESAGWVIGLSGLDSIYIPEMTFSWYLWSQWSAKYLYQLGILAAIILAAGAFSQEKAQGTLIFLASTPLTRAAIYHSKALAGLVLLAVCIFGSTGILLISSSAAGYSFPSVLYMASALVIFFGAAVVFQTTFIFSMFTSDAIKAGIGSFLLWIALSVPGWFPASRTYSMFYHIQSWELYLNNRFPLLFFLIMLFLSAALYRGGLALWERQEISS